MTMGTRHRLVRAMTLLLRDEQQADGRKEEGEIEGGRKAAQPRGCSLQTARRAEGDKEQTRSKEVAEKRGKFGTWADVHTRGTHARERTIYGGSPVSLPFSREPLEFSS